ncbi:MAG: Gfo/Idh/MocA family oxidoreductase [Verrucomicrobiales bacterium]|jgi:predicted dehydrogenase|nr:Gfo/Idh/MocA family oxidoreductase [Verrucomicrobiales bacterium]
MNTTPTRLGLIGAGGMGRAHRRFIRQMEQEGRARLTAAADVSAAALAEVAAEFNDRPPACFSDYRELLAAADVDAVVAVTPIPTHFAIAGAVIRSGIPLLLEKPPVPLLGQLRELLTLDAGRPVAVFFQHVCSRGVQLVRRALRDGKLGCLREIRTAAGWPRGRVYYQRAPWAGKMAADGEPIYDGPVTNAMAHFLHNVLYLAGQRDDTFARPVTVSGELYRAGKVESFDTAALRATFADDVQFTALFTHACGRQFAHVTEVRGDLGWARLHEDGSTTSSLPELTTPKPADEHDAFLNCYRDFLDFHQRRAARPMTRLVDTLPFVATTNAILSSSGGIHPVPGELVKTWRRDNDEGADLDGIHDLLAAVLTRAALPSEQGLAWAKAGRPLTVADLPPLTVADLVRLGRQP